MLNPRNLTVGWADQRRILDRKQQSGSLGGAARSWNGRAKGQKEKRTGDRCEEKKALFRFPDPILIYSIADCHQDGNIPQAMGPA